MFSGNNGPSNPTGQEAFRLRRQAAWSFMLSCAGGQIVGSKHWPSQGSKITDYKRNYGRGVRELANMHGVETKTIHTLHRDIVLLVSIAESNDSPLAELFDRFKSYDLARKRTLNLHAKYPQPRSEQC